MPPTIVMEHVSWAYSRSKTRALCDVNLEIAAGELLAVMGANGAGKSTFCKLLNGIIPHAQDGLMTGTVTVDGLVTADTPVAVLAGRVGMALEDPDAQLFTASVRDELAFGLENLLVPAEEIRERVAWAVAAAGLSRVADSSPAELSGGQKQRLAIAAALVMAKTVLALDESTTQIDPAGSKELLSLVSRLRTDRGLTVILATHNSEEAAEYADRICVLQNGMIAACGPPRDIFGDTALLEKCGIRAPQVSELAYSMKKRGAALPFFPVRFEEARRAALEWYQSNRTQ